ncbi:MAG: 3'-5' exonuclease [Planctomycetota bacterium]|nr:3'-5' exonuclease [Planctomycetota bacterium]
MSKSTAFLVFDIETVSDGRLLQRVRYPDEPELSPAEAVAKQRAELMEKTGSDFVPATFQVPVSVAIAKVGVDYGLQGLVTLDRPRFRPQVIVKHFWQGWMQYGMPTFVTFNGRGFDLPVMEMGAFRYGVSVPEWFTTSGPGYTQPRNRFNPSGHLDVQELLTNFGASRLNGGLDLCATLLGKPGKMDTKGYMVQDLWEAGETERIDDYCQCDALDTYFVFLRTMVMQGKVPLAREGELVAQAREVIAEKAETNPALGEYLAQFKPWEPVDDEGTGFVH